MEYTIAFKRPSICKRCCPDYLSNKRYGSTQKNDLNRESKTVPLGIHREKTKYMTNFKTDVTIKLKNLEVERVAEYIYLGKTLKLEYSTK